MHQDQLSEHFVAICSNDFSALTQQRLAQSEPHEGVLFGG